MIIEVGKNVKTVKAGESVVAVLWKGGAFAEEVVVSEDSVFRLPRESLIAPQDLRTKPR